MVEDPATDSVVSWSRGRIVLLFGILISFLPLCFRGILSIAIFQALFASLILMKVNPDRWEFASEGFLGGQRHLLKTIRRRRTVVQPIQPKQEFGPCIEVGQYGIEEELEGLKRDRSLLWQKL
ncbi:putative transcription factor HSF-type-DNA-binding family [Helianthus annuus]|nr:putative transcription factor HSF-type-DNA-binding family [Helianthus annuus]